MFLLSLFSIKLCQDIVEYCREDKLPRHEITAAQLGVDVRRIIDAAKQYRLPFPEFQVFDEMFRVNLYRKALSEGEWKDIGETSEKR